MKKIKTVLIGGALLLLLLVIFDVINTFIHTQSVYENEKEAEKGQNAANAIPHFAHIVIIVMENRSYEEIVNNTNSVYVNSLIKTGGLATNYSAITHPSLPNYLALLGGQTFRVKNDCLGCFIKKTNLIDQLEKAHISWRAYFESLPNPCYLGSVYPYTRKYNSFVYFTDIIKNTKRCHNIVPYTKLQVDLKNPQSAPQFIWISPNLCHDTHYCPVATGDKWLNTQIPLILSSPMFTQENSLLILTWDEAEKKGKNHIATIFLGPSVYAGYKSDRSYNHYSLLHTIEKAWNIPPISKAVGNTAVMSDFFHD